MRAQCCCGPVGGAVALARRQIGDPRNLFMRSLCRATQFSIETSHDVAVETPTSTEASMLDVVFIALGFVVIGLMVSYASGLRKL